MESKLKTIEKIWTGNWFALIEDAEDERRNWHLRMDNDQWRKHCKNLIQTWIGDLRGCFDYLDRMDAQRAEAREQGSNPEPEAEAPSMMDAAVTFRIWRNMVEEPWKYGDEDWEEWLRWNSELATKPGRWRQAAFWWRLQDEVDAKVHDEVAVKIQAAVRGHLVRSNVPFRDCALCLAHRICPIQMGVDAICRDCAAEQAPPHSECEVHTRICCWCSACLPADSTRPNFCSAACEAEYMRNWYDDSDSDSEDGADPSAWDPVDTPRFCAWCLAAIERSNSCRFCDPECEYDYNVDAWRGR